MSDWKNALRDIKKDTAGQESGTEQKPEKSPERLRKPLGGSRDSGYRKAGLDVGARTVGRQPPRVQRALQVDVMPPPPAHLRTAQLPAAKKPEQKPKSAPAKLSPPKPKGIPETLDGTGCARLDEAFVLHDAKILGLVWCPNTVFGDDGGAHDGHCYRFRFWNLLH